MCQCGSPVAVLGFWTATKLILLAMKKGEGKGNEPLISVKSVNFKSTLSRIPQEDCSIAHKN